MTRADVVVVALLAGLTGLLYAYTWSARAAADRVEIHVADHRFGGWALHPDRTLRIPGPIGDSVVEIRDGRVRFTEAPCRGKVCLRAGWLNEAGDLAACVPNRISVYLRGGEREYDSMNF